MWEGLKQNFEERADIFELHHCSKWKNMNSIFLSFKSLWNMISKLKMQDLKCLDLKAVYLGICSVCQKIVKELLRVRLKYVL